MNLTGVREALKQQPFRPLHLRLADGRSVLIRHPDFAMVDSGHRQLAVFTPPDDALMIIEPLLIVSMDFAPPAAAPAAGSNGTSGAAS